VTCFRDRARGVGYGRCGRWLGVTTNAREERRTAPARTADEAAERLRRAGFQVREQERKEPIRPLNVPGLDLSKALDEARGKRSR
jgi:hypothetical protein